MSVNDVSGGWVVRNGRLVQKGRQGVIELCWEKRRREDKRDDRGGLAKV